MTAIRLKDVAARAGVDAGTASRALNRSSGCERLSRDCVVRVRKAAEDLGYRPNYHARVMKSGKADAVGILLPAHSSGWYMSPMMAGISDGALSHGCHCVSIAPGGPEGPFSAALYFLEEGRIDGLIVPGAVCDSPEQLDLLEGMGEAGRLVFVQYSGKTELPAVNIDESAGMEKAFRHLAELGHRNLLYLEYDKEGDASIAIRRAAAGKSSGCLGINLRVCSLSAGRPADSVSREIENNLSVLNGIIGKKPEFTAAVCYNDILALSLYAALRAKDLRIPQEVSVVGFDDLFAEVAYPALTSVSSMFEKLGSRAADFIISGSRASVVKPIVPELIIRKSTSSSHF